MRLLISDTSVLLNLLAAECLESLSLETDFQFTICTAVRDETKTLRNATTGEAEPVDITPLVQSGLLTVLDVQTDEEANLYVDQAAHVDDGEAMSIALACCRSMDLAMDDRQAGNHARRLFPGIKIWTTPEILKTWSDTGRLPAPKLAVIIDLMEKRARYHPALNHPLAEWWDIAKHCR